MNGFLLDTNVVLIALSEPRQLTLPVRTALLAGPNYISVLTYWEVVIKSGKGRLEVGDPVFWWSAALEQLAANTLALSARHISGVAVLTRIHSDPFDRGLVAQAISENLTLLTTDAVVAGYRQHGLQTLS